MSEILKFPKNLAPLENQYKSDVGQSNFNSNNSKDKNHSSRGLIFPAGFYWGTATSAYQVEGGIRNDWSEAGKKYDAGVACDHYNRFEEDFNLAKAMNNNAHRFSIEWARIEPEQGKFDQKEIEHYKKVVLVLRERGLEPFITLNHFTLPVWFAKKGGWLNKKAPEYFVRYVEFVVKNFSEIKFWITFNEPNVYVSHAFLKGIWPPFKKNWFKAEKALNQLIVSHKNAYQIIHKVIPDSKIGIAKCNIDYKGILKFIAGHNWNYKFLDGIKEHQDFIGLNYYHHKSLSEIVNPSRKERTDMGWQIYPKGIYHVLKDLKKKYNKPIYITENGIAIADDKKRAKFIIDHLKWTHKAIEEGVDVKGYIYWSLMDNFEWAYGFKPRFGLIEIDYKTLERKLRPNSKVYAEICKENTIKL